MFSVGDKVKIIYPDTPQYYGKIGVVVPNLLGTTAIKVLFSDGKITTWLKTSLAKVPFAKGDYVVVTEGVEKYKPKLIGKKGILHSYGGDVDPKGDWWYVTFPDYEPTALWLVDVHFCFEDQQDIPAKAPLPPAKPPRILNAPKQNV